MIEILEYSEDRKRGELPHIKRLVEGLTRRLDGLCARCGRRRATHVIDPYQALRAVCDGCYSAWCDMSPIERRLARHRGWAERGGR